MGFMLDLSLICFHQTYGDISDADRSLILNSFETFSIHLGGRSSVTLTKILVCEEFVIDGCGI